MPRVGDCKKGKIYAIRSHQTDLIYIGSTTQTLAQRMGIHRQNYKQYKEGKFNNISSFEILQYENCYIELLEDYPCENINNLRKREGEWIRNSNCVNKLIAGRIPKQYRKENKEYIAQRDKTYREENKEYIAQKQKEYREENKYKIKQQKGKYREKNKEYIAEKYKKYYEENKQTILEKRNLYQSKIIQCSCGSWFRKYSIQKHLKSQIHYDNMIGLSSFGF